MADDQKFIDDQKVIKATTGQWEDAGFGRIGGLDKRPGDALARHLSILSLSFRMKPEILALSNEGFCEHCYRTILGREPEKKLLANVRNVEATKDKIKYWREIIGSEEFRRKNLAFEGEIDRRLLASLGWSQRNNFLTYALRFERLRLPDLKSFLDMISARLLENSFTNDDMNEIFGAGDAQLRYYFDAVVNLAAEYLAGLDRLAAFEGVVQRLAGEIGSRPGDVKKEGKSKRGLENAQIELQAEVNRATDVHDTNS